MKTLLINSVNFFLDKFIFIYLSIQRNNKEDEKRRKKKG